MQNTCFKCFSTYVLHICYSVVECFLIMTYFLVVLKNSFLFHVKVCNSAV